MGSFCDILFVITCAIFVRCDTNSEETTTFIPTPFQSECLKIFREISSNLKNISDKIDTGNLYVSQTLNQASHVKQHEQSTQELEEILREILLGWNRTDGILTEHEEKINNLQNVVKNLVTSTTRNFSAVEMDFSLKIANLEERANKFEIFMNRSFEKLTFAAESLNSSFSKLNASTCTCPKDSTNAQAVSLWVSTVRGYSSQYNSGSWSANQVIGNADVYPAYGDKVNTWAQASAQLTANEYLEVEFAEPLYVEHVNIYETYNAGGVKEIKFLNPSGQWETVWITSQVQQIATSRIFSPKIKKTNYPTDILHITVDCTVARTYVEIDAIEIIGTRPSSEMISDVELWVSSIKGFSSQYNTGSWAAIQVIGNPDVYPAYGDKHNTWAQASGQFTANQYIQVGFAERLYLKQVHIYETYNAGGVKEIKSLNPSGQWETIWSTNQAQRIQASRIFSPPIKRTDFPTDTLHVTVDCTVAGTYVEIDAIQIKGSRMND